MNTSDILRDVLIAEHYFANNPPKPMTNADRIRAMSDEELAMQLVAEQIVAGATLIEGLGDKELLVDYELEVLKAKKEMVQEKLDWLKAEVEE